MSHPGAERGPSKIKRAKSQFHFLKRHTRVGALSLAISTPSLDLWLRHCVEVLECEQPTLEEKLRGKYKVIKQYIFMLASPLNPNHHHHHACLRMLMWLLNRQRYKNLFIGIDNSSTGYGTNDFIRQQKKVLTSLLILKNCLLACTEINQIHNLTVLNQY